VARRSVLTKKNEIHGINENADLGHNAPDDAVSANRRKALAKLGALASLTPVATAILKPGSAHAGDDGGSPGGGAGGGGGGGDI